MKLMEGKKGVIFGVANKNSIAWAIASALSEQGATLAFNYANERLEKNVRKLADTLEGSVIAPCDVSSDEEIEAFFKTLDGEGFGEIDFIVHSVAFANRDDLAKPFSTQSREGFHLAHDISAYSLVGIVKAAGDRLKEGSSILSMTYLGAVRVFPNYNIMGVAKASLEASIRYLAADVGGRGIRVNGLSAGPINTLAARGIGDFNYILKHVGSRAPMGRNVNLEEVANAGVFLVSPWAGGVTGEVLHVDCGYNILGM